MFNYIENILILASVFTTFLVIFLSNPIQSLLMLIVSFAFSSMLFMMLGIEFISLLIFIIYIGAIAVLFLFIIMMLNIKIVELRNFYYRYLPVGGFIIIFFFFEICFFIYIEYYNVYLNVVFIDWVNTICLLDNVYLLSTLIYTYYSVYFYNLAILLLISMLGSIVLVLNRKIVFSRKLYSKFSIKKTKKKKKYKIFFFK